VFADKFSFLRANGSDEPKVCVDEGAGAGRTGSQSWRSRGSHRLELRTGQLATSVRQ